MPRTAKKPMETIQIRLPSTVLAWIDHYRNNQQIPPSRSEMIRWLIEQGKTKLQIRTRVQLDDEQ
jgi:hypothetical protein